MLQNQNIDHPATSENISVDKIRCELDKCEPTTSSRIIEKVILAALGSIPWAGGVLSVAATYKTEEGSIKTNKLYRQWLEEHQKKITLLQSTFDNIQSRYEDLGSIIDDRIQSEEYLTHVRHAFRIWDEVATTEKRNYIANIIINTAGTRACPDDVVRLFIDWIKLYHEAHFTIIREIFQNPGSTRYEIWSSIYGDLPREDSAEADLFKVLIRDLSTGGVIRQERAVNYAGQFVRQRQRQLRKPTTSTLESAFEDTKEYVLTELGKQFIHYTMNEAVTRIDGSESSSNNGNSNTI